MTFFGRPARNPHAETQSFIDDEFSCMDSAAVDWSRASLPTDDYNCMGFAVDSPKWLEPPIVESPSGLLLNPASMWPERIQPVPHTPNLVWPVDLYIRGATLVGFEKRNGPEWEEGFRKIVIFANGGFFRHASVQTAPGRWESKMGELSDIAHAFSDFEESPYGGEPYFLRRPNDWKPTEAVASLFPNY